MQPKYCKKCNSSNSVKNRVVRGKQRYKCKECGCNYVQGDNRGKIGSEAKALGMLLYGSGKASYGMISRLFKVSCPAVLHWIKTMGSKLPEPSIDNTIKEVQIDEMWHFINKKNKKYGYREPWIVVETKPLDGLLAVVMLKPFKSSMSGLKM